MSKNRSLIPLLLFFFLLPLLVLAISQRDAGAQYGNNGYVPVVAGWPNRPYSNASETEPNNSWNQANGALINNREYKGRFPNKGDEKDYYFFYQGQAGPVKLWLRAIGSGHNYDLVLRDSNLEEVGYSGELENSDENIGKRLGPGLYYVQVYNRSQTGSSQNYSLVVNYMPPPPPAPTWTPVPTITPTPTPTDTPTPTVTPTPAKSWVEVGQGSASGDGIIVDNGDAYHPCMAISQDNLPMVAWSNNSKDGFQIYAKKWNGVRWDEIGEGSASSGGISDNDRQSSFCSLAIASDGVPYVAWADQFKKEIYVRRLNGRTWEEVGRGSATGNGISNDGGSNFPDVAIAPDGTAYVAWRIWELGNYQIYVRRWNGSQWEEVGNDSATNGGISNTGTTSNVPSIAIDKNGTPYVTWEDYDGEDSEIYVRRWNGSSWVEVGSGSARGGGISNNSGRSYDPNISIGSDNLPYISWSDTSGGNWEIYVKRWNGSSWVEVGSGSARGGGISSNSGESVWSNISVLPNGRLIVSWYDDSSGRNEIYARQWDGNSWIEISAGSASQGGISKVGGAYASLAVSKSGVPYITWGSDRHVLIRRYQ